MSPLRVRFSGETARQQLARCFCTEMSIDRAQALILRQAGLIACCLAIVAAIVYLLPNLGGWLFD